MNITYIRPMYPLDQMEGSEDLDWCRCYQADDDSENYYVRNEGSIESVRVDGQDDESAEAMDHLAARVNPDYDPEIDAEEQTISRMHRCGCLSCPWCEICGAMNDDPVGEIYRVNDDGDTTYYVQDDYLNIREIDEGDVYYPLTPDEDPPTPFEVEKARLFAQNHFSDDEKED